MLGGYVLNTERSTIQHITNYSQIDWDKIESYVMKLQQRIFLAEENQDVKKLKQLQKILINSKANLLLSLKEATKLNINRRSAGVDNYKSLTNKEFVDLYNDLLTYNINTIKPLFVQNIKKQQSSKKLQSQQKSFIKDKVFQLIIKRALEPQWEAKFEPNVYGYRPGRSFRDAIGSIFNKVGPKKRRQWILKINLSNDMSNLNVDFVDRLLDNFPYKHVIISWLRNNYMNIYEQSKYIYGLIHNILLHGIENLLGNRYNKKHVQVNDSPMMVRYENEIAVICFSKEEAKETNNKIIAFLTKRGLKEKSFSINHIEEGFDFHEFNIRLYEASKDIHSTQKKLLIKPSKKAISNVKQQIKNVFDKYKGQNVGFIIKKLNPIIVGISYRWRFVVACNAYKTLDYYLDYKMYRYLRHLHPHKGWKWIKQTYYKQCIRHSVAYRICDPKDSTNTLCNFSAVSIKRHVLVTFKNSIFDRRLKDYWIKRKIIMFYLTNGDFKSKLAQRQKFTCPHCRKPIYDDEALEMNHIMPRKFGGEDTYRNMQLMHISCHIQHHKDYKTLEDYQRYEIEQKQWYDSLYND